jgi:hypothetical protein
MAMWLYQLSEKDWSANNYRLDVWEGERWEWRIGRMIGSESPPAPGDTVVFFYAPSGSSEPGFYGWAVILLWTIEDSPRFYFRPVAPSDQLKMYPWGDEEAIAIADKVRGTVKRGTLWPVPENLAVAIGRGINAWVGAEDV